MGMNRTLWLILLLSATVLTLSTSRTLNTVKELADSSIEFGKTFPRHGLLLLHWFAVTLQFKQTPRDSTQLVNIKPSRGDYGFHSYYDGIQGIPASSGIPLSSSRHALWQYFSMGDLNTIINPRSRQLPSYITEDYYNSPSHPDRNRDRIVIQISKDVRDRASGVPLTQVLGVFITQCHAADSPSPLPRLGCLYYESNTFEVSVQLLKRIQQLKLDTFLQQAGYDMHNRDVLRGQRFGCSWGTQEESGAGGPCNVTLSVNLEVVTSSEAGYARMSWRGIPQTALEKGVVLMLYSNMDSPEELFSHNVAGHQSSGAVATTVHLDPGLQVALAQRTGPQSHMKIWVGPEFDEANGKLPTPVAGYDASLLLFVKQGKACARLYIQKIFSNWKAAGRFGSSWVALYKNRSENSMRTQTWQWATKFTRNAGKDTEKYVAYDYNSDMDISPGVEARFFLGRDYSSERARTGPWEQPQVRLEVQPPGWCGVGLFNEQITT